MTPRELLRPLQFRNVFELVKQCEIKKQKH